MPVLQNAEGDFNVLNSKVTQRGELHYTLRGWESKNNNNNKTQLETSVGKSLLRSVSAKWTTLIKYQKKG